jgi:ribosomal protein S18 acetylase RimI-like enzyme
MELVKKEMPKQEAKAKSIKPRLERLTPTLIVEAWKLLERQLREAPQSYPDLSEESPETIRHHLFQYLNQPTTIGLLMKVGRKPVGMILGDVRRRPYGKPQVYCHIFTAWIEPEYRKKGLMSSLSKEYFSGLKKAGVFYWEASTHGALTEVLLKNEGVRRLSDLIGGKC